MKNFSKALATVLVLASFIGCTRGGSTAAVTPTQVPPTAANPPAEISSEEISSEEISSFDSTKNPVSFSVDGTNCSMGESIHPTYIGKSFETRDLRYTLLDARIADLNASPMLKATVQYNKVLLVILEVENIAPGSYAGYISADEVELTRNSPPQDDRSKDDAYPYDLVHIRSLNCLDLGHHHDPGYFAHGQKVTGYYIYGLTDDKPYDGGLYFGGRNYGVDAVAGSFKLQ